MITIVSGLPRSGTSLMMQILDAGGISPFCDNQRKPDENNPRGYFESEKVKRLKTDNSWIKNANGKALKVISFLLSDLPIDQSYKIIFMTRNISEILVSQRKMLVDRNKTGTIADDEKIRQHYQKHLKQVRDWLNLADEINVFYCDYNRLIHSTSESVKELVAFMESELDYAKMIAAVDKRLYRQRI